MTDFKGKEWKIETKNIIASNKENNKLLFAAKLTSTPILILSATIADFPEKSHNRGPHR